MSGSAQNSRPGDAVCSFPVALVTMPLGSYYLPSLPIGQLKAICRRAGFPADDYYLNLDIAVQMGFALYEELQAMPSMGFTGDWVFSAAAFGDERNPSDYRGAFPKEVARIADATGKDGAYLQDLRDRVIPAYVEDCLNRIDWGSYRAIGFLAGFQQGVASLALARRIKERHPHVRIVFFGFGVEGEIGVEYVRAFSCIDYVVSGETEEVFPNILTCLAEGREPNDLVGVVGRNGSGVSFIGPAAPVRNLDDLPIPDYDTFYEAARQYKLDEVDYTKFFPPPKFRSGAVPFEGSRGCWWGRKSHCVFCGTNRADTSYRSKSPERLLAELDELSRRYGAKAFLACDSILDMKYIEEVFGQLGARGSGYEFFFFTKSNLTREHVRVLAHGGMRLIFPGIESLSSHVLKLIRKGVSRLQNVNLLRWCTYYGIDVTWFLLHGVPGERPEDYVEELETARLIVHLAPPEGSVRLRLERFSPMFDDEGLFPTKWRRPNPGYGYVYPPHVNTEEIAFFFDYEPCGEILPEEAHLQTKAHVAAWHSDWKSGRRSSLSYRREGSEVVIDDTRLGMDRSRSYTLPSEDAAIYEAFSDAPRTPAQVCAALAATSPDLDIDEETIAAACETFCDAGLMIGEAGKFLSLAIPAEPES
jgi:ribosomal peptide maturation radical SAM protein 1